MIYLKYNIIVLCLLSYTLLNGQFDLQGTVIGKEGHLPFADVMLEEVWTQTNEKGEFLFTDVNKGHYNLKVNFLGYQPFEQIIDVPLNQPLQITLQPDLNLFDEVVVTGTKTFKRKTNSAVIVNVVDRQTLGDVQACNLSDGLKFQPGLRVETDCQTCNYTQLRMNGLAGGYAQILINGRPIFSPLTGLYGLEQIPVNMIDRIEVIRGGGSSLYGSSAIGGTVNIISRLPQENSLSVNTSYQRINGEANDFLLNGNSTLVSKNKNSGVSFFVHNRERATYDHNGDGFSELPKLKNTSFGLKGFYLPSTNQKLELSLSNLNEYRYGGEMVEKAPHQALQSEERTHNVWMGNLDYQLNFNNSSLIAYAALQMTDRDHYTGIVPDTTETFEYIEHFLNPPYGNSLTLTHQYGLQLNHKLNNFLHGVNVFTLGAEYLLDDTFDEIPSYNYSIDQTTKDLGMFAQSDWEILPQLNLLSGIRIDRHNLVDKLIWSPRFSLLYKMFSNMQIRAGFGTGFRAPQAFDTDLHIAFAGGGVSRVQLAENLKEEKSSSYNLSINYDRPTENWIAGFTLEGFYTRLDDAFALIPLGEDDFGELFEKRNDQGAIVQGITLELRGNWNKKVQIESGLTYQSSKFDQEVQYIEEIDGVKDFIRTPNLYGFTNLTLNPTSSIKANVNYIYTGSMLVPHFAGAPNQLTDEIIHSRPFHEVNVKLSYSLPIKSKVGCDIYTGCKNVFNEYQSDFDIGKNRDSNYVYGPALPRSFFVGMEFRL